MVLFLSTLGLRPRELSELRLEDIDWRNGTLRLTTRKTRRSTVLPLLREAGEALVTYLQNARPETTERRVFVQHNSRHFGAALSAPAITGAVIRAIRRAGVDSPIEGAYVIRHTVASRLVNRGASLKEVVDFLGHQSLDTTTNYAKLDLSALQDVALPWPEVSP